MVSASNLTTSKLLLGQMVRRRPVPCLHLYTLTSKGSNVPTLSTHSSVQSTRSQQLTLDTGAGQLRAEPEPSRDFSQIPPHRTTADTILTWSIFQGTFRENYLIEPLLYDPEVSDPQIHQSGADDRDTFTMINSLAPLEDQKIPSLVDNFLQNVHTKNPILDVETLVLKSREAATQGLGWDAWSCLLLLACALGYIAKPFGTFEGLHITEIYARNPTSQRELQQGENCFVLACRRLGLLKHTMLAAQCHFFAGGRCLPTAEYCFTNNIQSISCTRFVLCSAGSTSTLRQRHIRCS